MIDKEKLVDVFIHMGDHIRSLDEYGFGYDSTLAEAIEDVVAMLKQPEAVLDNQVSSSKWIPVSERFPEENADVLCCRGNHIGALMDVYTYKGDGKWEDTYGYWNYTDIEGITHWMPLPELPKEGE